KQKPAWLVTARMAKTTTRRIQPSNTIGSFHRRSFHAPAFAFLPVGLPFLGPCRILPSVNDLTVTQLTDRLLDSYAKVGGINHLDGKNLPSKSAIAAITTDLLRLLFPGFFDDRPAHSSELKVGTATLMDSVWERLEE